MSYTIGDTFIDVTLPGKDHGELQEFSEGTEDPNPIHLDRAFAKAAGFPTVLQQGAMTTAHFARLLVEEVGRDSLRWLDVTFTSPVYPGENLQIKAQVTGVEATMVTCSLTAETGDGTITARAEAGFANDGRV